MKFSKLFIKTKKDYPKDEVAVSSQLLIRAGYIDKVAAGVYTLLPFGLKVVSKIITQIRSEMDAADAQEIYMPGLVPKANWETTDRWKTFDALYKLKGADEREFALGATHEEIVVPLAREFVESYKDLPLALYQIQNKFRNEIRAKSGVLRTREFLMKDLYSFHKNEEDLNQYYDKMIQSYWNIFDKCGIKEKTYLTFASGGTFCKYSHEFQTETEAGEDEIYVCAECKTGLNSDILADQENGKFKCPDCANTEYEIKKAVEVGNIFKLGTKYSKPFDLNFVDEKGKKNLVIMGCYGIGIQRLMGTIVEINHDEKGIIWPKAVAPYDVHLISLEGSEKRGEEVYQALFKAGISVLYDDRDISAGEKFADCDLIGIPYRLVVSQRTQDKIEVKKRDEDETKQLSEEELLKILG
ncbi:MAG: His/Gly/Thr/Pro-type tRNA ligase C-terminal domain-containing protein [Candidatus Berkelbacteria bacterium]|nr:His/Gly/Thr/Pro-type tRNA ligase C-terminal domain-containing protein [Candidatus Berkelbacteria bacterium]